MFEETSTKFMQYGSRLLTEAIANSSTHEGAGESHSENSSHSAHDHSSDNIILFVCISLTLGALIKELNKKTGVKHLNALLLSFHLIRFHILQCFLFLVSSLENIRIIYGSWNIL